MNSLCAAAICAVLSGGLPAVTKAAADPQETVVNGSVVASAHALWRLPGYGMVLDLQSEPLAVYHYARGLCWVDSELESAGAVRDFVPYYSYVSPHTMVFWTAPEGGTAYRAESLPTLPLECSGAEDRASPRFVFEAAARSLAAFYPFQKERGVDLERRAAELLPTLHTTTTDDELRAAFEELLRGLTDAHTSIAGAIGGRPFRIRSFRGETFARLHRQFEQLNTSQGLFVSWLKESWIPGEIKEIHALLGSVKHALDGRILWGVLPGNVGYLAIGEMADFGKDSDVAKDRRLLGPALDEALHELQRTRALVLDVSFNFGGSDEVAADIASRFADRTRLAYSKRAFREPVAQDFYVTPARGIRYRKPVALLTSELTSSAAEVFVLRMRTISSVTQMGEPTQGIFSDALEKTLPNGWTLSMSSEIYSDPTGKSFEGRGLPPSVLIPVFRSGGDDHVAAVKRAAALVSSPHELGPLWGREATLARLRIPHDCWRRCHTDPEAPSAPILQWTCQYGLRACP